jgi:hypothetical protein
MTGWLAQQGSPNSLGHGGIASATSQNWPKLELIFLTQAKMQCSINSQAYDYK